MLRRSIAVLSVVTLFVLAVLFGAHSPRINAANEPTASPASQDTTRHKKLSKEERMLGGTPQDIQLTSEEQRFVELTNADRKANGAGELTVAPLLVKVAREKSKEMHDLNYWGHESPVPEKRTAMRRLLYYLPEPPQTMTVGENLYYCSQVRVDEGEKALMNSPTHRKNILNPDYKYVGIGTYTAPDGQFWTSEVFLKIQY